MAMMQSVSKSVLASPRVEMERLTCSIEATPMPPLWPSLQPWSSSEQTELLNCSAVASSTAPSSPSSL